MTQLLVGMELKTLFLSNSSHFLEKVGLGGGGVQTSLASQLRGPCVILAVHIYD